MVLMIYRDEYYNPDTANKASRRSTSPNNGPARPTGVVLGGGSLGFRSFLPYMVNYQE